MKKKFLTLCAMIAYFSFGSAYAGDYVTIELDNLKSNSATYPFGDYKDFFQSADRPPLISFTITMADDCVITDAIGNELNVNSSTTVNISELYFPFKIWDVADSNKCDNSSYSNIEIKTDSLVSDSKSYSRRISQSRPFSITHLSGLKGANTNINFSAVFKENFENMTCLQIKLVDSNGQEDLISPSSPKISLVDRSLPITIEYSPLCLTSRLSPENQEDIREDLRFTIEVSLTP